MELTDKIDVADMYVKKLENQISTTNREKLILETNCDIYVKLLQMKEDENAELVKENAESLKTIKDLHDEIAEKEEETRNERVQNQVLLNKLQDIENKYTHLQLLYNLKEKQEIEKENVGSN